MTYLVGASSRCSTWLLRGQMSAFGLPKSLQLKPLGLQAPKPPSAQEPAAYGASEEAAVAMAIHLRLALSQSNLTVRIFGLVSTCNSHSPGIVSQWGGHPKPWA